MNNADIISSTSNVMAKEIKYFVKNKNVVITPFGIDTNQFIKKKNTKKVENITVGTIKNLSEIYGIDILIKGFAIAHKELLTIRFRISKKIEVKNCR